MDGSYFEADLIEQFCLAETDYEACMLSDTLTDTCTGTTIISLNYVCTCAHYYSHVNFLLI